METDSTGAGGRNRHTEKIKVDHNKLAAEWPFPMEDLQRHCPLFVAFIRGLARAGGSPAEALFSIFLTIANLFMDPVDVFAHIYDGAVRPILFCHICMDSGAGEGPMLARMEGFLSSYIKKFQAAFDAEFQEENQARQEWEAMEPAEREGERPPEPFGRTVNWMYKYGSMTGFGKQVAGSTPKGRGAFFRHEGGLWLKSISAGGPAGSFEQVNELESGQVFCNNPTNKDGKFYVERSPTIFITLGHVEDKLEMDSAGADYANGAVRVPMGVYPSVAYFAKQNPEGMRKVLQGLGPGVAEHPCHNVWRWIETFVTSRVGGRRGHAFLNIDPF